MEHKILVFDWKGFFAHFRQFDTNSSSLSYSFPPPTVIMGMVAGLLGIERDDYYELLNRPVLQIAVQIRTTPRKVTQTMNYIFAKSPGELNMSGPNKHTQIPAELVVAKEFPMAPLAYRIFLKFAESELFEQVQNGLSQQQYRYLPYLGSAPFTSWLEWLGVPDSSETLPSSQEVVIDSVADVKAVELRSLSLDPINDQMPAFFREHMRRSFRPGREPGELVDVIWERNRGKIKARFTEPVYCLQLGKDSVNVTFL